MRVLVCGGRNYDDFETVRATLQRLAPEIIIHGGAAGADRLAHRYAENNNIKTIVFEADWARHGRAAGPKRNAAMIADGKPDVVVAFPGGRGTADMRRKAVAAGIRLIVVGDDE